MAEVEPQFASDYDDRTTVAVRSVLVEIGQVLGSYRGKFAVIGGAVPWLLLNEADMVHVGTLDVDLGLDAEALGDGEYAQLVESLLKQGYDQRKHRPRFQLVRTVPSRDDGADALVEATRPLLDFEAARTGYLNISKKFRHSEDFGPTSVRQFVDRPDILGERSADQWQQDAFGQVEAWLSALGLK